MIVNGTSLLAAGPIKDMLTTDAKFKGTSYGLSVAGYDIRLKQDITFKPEQKTVIVDDKISYQTNFTLASAIEEFDMPNNLVATVKDKSTWARKGLSVFNTVIEPSWRGFLTLELVYHGNTILHIPAGVGIAQVLFQDLAQTAVYNGKYQDQMDEPVQAKLI